ncbi:uncharacterized protein BJ171DRAFT_595962 [Polychytrium aggregatum]|uniref:uncharacterized protein n=1 Tax=Polychytrium aggregatum TaxID=110093 RepID=UPI0022FF1DD4|nr:uncharacterized protein BJ171DRAFT_595962 [Polychytrium aggregatum]KAI9208154.1 hypothetical protein BJ171DRAFT_595962 [Polychytrium aggregatum]
MGPNRTEDIEDLRKPEPEEDWVAIHQEAVERGELTYTDPKTGYSVFTELSHKQRGYCCGNRCRHCPFDHSNVDNPAKLKEDTRNARLAKQRQRQQTASDSSESS